MNMITSNSLPNPEWGHSDTGKAADNGICYIDYTREQLLRMLSGEKAPLHGGSEGDKRERSNTRECREAILKLLKKGPVSGKKLKRKYGQMRLANVMQQLRKNGCIIECTPKTLPDGKKDYSDRTYILISDENYTEK